MKAIILTHGNGDIETITANSLKGYIESQIREQTLTTVKQKNIMSFVKEAVEDMSGMVMTAENFKVFLSQAVSTLTEFENYTPYSRYSEIYSKN